MEERDTINILISQLLCKEDENLSLRRQLDSLNKALIALQEERQAGDTLFHKKMDEVLLELQRMRKDYKKLGDELFKAKQAVAEAKHENEILTQALETLKNTRAEELLEIEKQKRKLYGRKSEKASLLNKNKDKDLKQDKDDFDGSNTPNDNSVTPGSAEVKNDSAGEKPAQKTASKPMRMDYSKNATRVKDVVMHHCDGENLPADARQIDARHWILYKMEWSVTKHVFEILRLVDKEGSISSYYEPLDKADEMKPFENVLPGYHVDMDMIAQIMVDKYQYSMSLERVVERLKDGGAHFSSSTVLNWVHKHADVLKKLDAPLREQLLSEGSFLFCDETTELVRVKNESTGKYEYRKKYIWGIKNPALKVAYYLYDNGSRSMKVAENFFRNFFGSITTDGYNVYKLFDREGSKITRYGCMAHVRRKFVDAMNTDSRSVEIVNLISELYWVEADMKIQFLTEEQREKERKRRSVPVLAEMWQRLKTIFDQTKECSANLFIKAVRYIVAEWDAVCRYATNGKAEIDNNTAERMMKPICLGRNNYLFCGSEAAAKNTSLIYSIIETCKMNGLRPVKYIADVLRKLVAGETDYAALLPINIAK